MGEAGVEAEVEAGALVEAGPEVEVGAGVHPETSLDASSKEDAVPALTVIVKAADTDEAEVEAGAERSTRATLKVAAGVAAAVKARAGVAAVAGTEVGTGQRTGPARKGAKSAESEKKVTRGGGS